MNKRRGLNHPPVQIKRAVILRDHGLCVLRLDNCTGVAVTTDHRANRGAGGSRILNHPSNLVGACIRCNGDKADAEIDILDALEAKGLYIRPAATNDKTLIRAQLTPVQYPDGSWWRLIDASTREPWKDAA